MGFIDEIMGKKSEPDEEQEAFSLSDAIEPRKQLEEKEQRAVPPGTSREDVIPLPKSQNQLHTNEHILARRVLFIPQDMPDTQLKAIQKLRDRYAVVANTPGAILRLSKLEMAVLVILDKYNP